MMITLTAEASRGFGQYIARIFGRDPKFTFSRDFIGKKYGRRRDETRADVDEPGLYECCDARRNGKEATYWLILPYDNGLAQMECAKEDAMAIATELDAGRPIDQIAIATPADPSTGDAYAYSIVDATTGRLKSVEAIANACWVYLQDLDPKDRSMVLTILGNVHRRAEQKEEEED